MVWDKVGKGGDDAIYASTSLAVHNTAVTGVVAIAVAVGGGNGHDAGGAMQPFSRCINLLEARRRAASEPLLHVD